MKSKESRPETKDSKLLEILGAGWKVQKCQSKEYMVLMKGDEELVYSTSQQKIISVYKR